MLLKIKFCNQLKAIIPEKYLDITVKNILINGVRRGCSGHITYKPTGRCVYINTEEALCMPGLCLYRYAQDKTDFSSNRPGHQYPNQFAKEADLARQVAAMLTKHV